MKIILFLFFVSYPVFSTEVFVCSWDSPDSYSCKELSPSTSLMEDLVIPVAIFDEGENTD